MNVNKIFPLPCLVVRQVLSVMKLLGRPYFKFKRSFLVFEPKMLPFLVRAFFVIFRIFCLTSLKLRLDKVDKGLLHDISTFYDHFKSYMFWSSKQKIKFILIFTSFSSLLKICHLFPSCQEASSRV